MRIETKFHMKTHYDKLGKIHTNCSGHMTKVAAMPIYSKKPLRTRMLMTLGLAMEHCKCGPYQVCTNDDSWLILIFFTARSNLMPNALIWGKC